MLPTDHDVLLEAILANLSWYVDLFHTEGVAFGHHLASYADLEPQNGDFGILAHLADHWVGVTWLRFFSSADHGYAYVADDVPELGVCVRKAARRQGLGRELLTRSLSVAAAGGLRGVSLCIHRDNVARRLCDEMGFTEYSRTDGRITMLAGRDALESAAASRSLSHIM
ncbi:MAG: GNAT family N-acetyltransferase [Bifidobacteriaceae bacterium]|nr:GNAT family N-acetyltransferase [Bifidobacteriaceae bacterium]